MKNNILYTVCAGLILTACTSNTDNGGPTIFQGKFIGYHDEFVEFFLPTDDGDFKEIQINVNSDGTFCDTIQFDKNYYDAPIFADKFMFRVCLEQGKIYTAEFDITKEGEETNFNFIGEGHDENEFLKHYWAIDLIEEAKPATSFAEIRSLMDNVYAPLKAELNAIGNKPFVKYYTDELSKKENMVTCYLPFIKADNAGLYSDDPEFSSFIAKNFKLSDAEFQATMNNVFTNASYYFSGLDATAALQAAASCTANPAQKELAIALMAASYIGAGNSKGLAEAYDYFMDNVSNQDYLDGVGSMFDSALNLAPGVEAPEIEFVDTDGNTHSLAEFKGKPLYIDLWASWCGPCCEEIPHLAKFVESLGSNPEIVCISISIDEEESDWTAKLDEVGSTWPQYLATENGQKSISTKYNVSAIPRFLLLDAEGKIASINAPRPSDPDLLSELKDLL